MSQYTVPKHKKAKNLLPGETIVGVGGGTTAVLKTAYATVKSGMYTVWTEFGELVFDPEEEIEVKE